MSDKPPTPVPNPNAPASSPISDNTRASWPARSGRPRLTAAAFLIIAGIILFLSNLGLLPIHNIWAYWPLYLIVIGIGKILGSSRSTDAIWGGLFVLFGTVLLLSNLHVWSPSRRDWGLLGGVALIGIGLLSLRQNFWLDMSCGKHRRLRQNMNFSTKDRSLPDERLIKESAVLGSVNRRIESSEFLGGNVEAVFGSVELDLRLAAPPPGTQAINIHVNIAFGSAKLRIPANWRLSMRVSSALGSTEDKRLPLTRGEQPITTLFLTGSSVFSSLEIED